MTVLSQQSGGNTNQPVRIKQTEPAKVEKKQDTAPNSTSVPPTAMTPVAIPYNPNVIGPNLLINWQAPIEFYGKVIDETSNAVAGATISFHWVEVPDETGNRTTNTESDAKGLFSLQGARGPSLSVFVNKDGYYPQKGGAKYGPLGGESFSPNPLNPVIFQMRKKGNAELLVALKRNYRILRDGTPISINLDTGDTASGETGNFVIRCWTKDEGKRSGEKYDWHCVITSYGGGFILLDEEYPFLAPEKEYKTPIEIKMPADRPDWKSQVDLKFYYRLADGRYGRMSFSMIAGGQHFCMIDSVLNPSGSRNLESK